MGELASYLNGRQKLDGPGPTYYHGGTATVLTCDAHNRECTVLARVLFRNVDLPELGAVKVIITEPP